MYGNAVHDRATQLSNNVYLERAYTYLERAKRCTRERRTYEAGIFYAKARKLLLSILRRNGVKGMKATQNTGNDMSEIEEEKITELMERAWQVMGA